MFSDYTERKALGVFFTNALPVEGKPTGALSKAILETSLAYGENMPICTDGTIGSAADL